MKISKRKFMLIQAKRCMTRKDVVAAGVAVGTVQNILNEKEVRPVTVGRVAKALGCEVEELLEDQKQ